MQQRFGERSVDHVWNCWIWKRKIRGLPMCIFEIIQESCVVIWSFIEKILTHVYLELISRGFFLPCRRSHCVQLYIHVSLFLIREDQYQGKKTTYNHWRIALKIKTLQVHHRYPWFFPYVIQITYLINTQMEKTSFRNVVFIVWSRFRKRGRLGFNLKGVCL